MTSIYYAGNLVDFFATFTNAAGAATDPSTVAFVYKNSTSSSITLTWDGSSSSPALGTVWRTGTGTFTARIDTTNMVAGTLNTSWESTGSSQAVGVDVVMIKANPSVS